MVALRDSREELHARLVLRRVHGSLPGYATLATFLTDLLLDQYILLQLLSRGGYFKLEFRHTNAAARCIGLGSGILEGQTIRFFLWINGFSAETPLSDVQPGIVIQVQFPDLDPIFQIVEWLRKIALLIGEVLSIKRSGVALKQPSGPVIEVRVLDLSKLPGVIHAPKIQSGVEGITLTEYKVSYSGLHNQCNWCRKIGHGVHDYPFNHKKKLVTIDPPQGSPHRGQMAKEETPRRMDSSYCNPRRKLEVGAKR